MREGAVVAGVFVYMYNIIYILVLGRPKAGLKAGLTAGLSAGLSAGLTAVLTGIIVVILRVPY